MIDLHVHLDGSLTAEEIFSLAQMQNLPPLAASPSELARELTAPPDCRDLNEYLKAFERPLSVLQSREAVAFAIEALLTRLSKSGFSYVEIRFAPQLHTRNGISQQEIVRAAVDALQQTLAVIHPMKANLILCCMRGSDNERQNLETISIAKEFLGQGVCAVDLAGAEKLYPTAFFEPIFKKAAALGLPYTIHAGEADGPDSVWEALHMGASRIGHGVQSAKDPRLMDYLAEKQIPLELCFSSNLQTKAVSSAKAFPLLEFLKRGVLVTINTDNLTVSDTTLMREFELIKAQFSLSDEQINQLHQNARRAAFADLSAD